jgi:hypothetical protein
MGLANGTLYDVLALNEGTGNVTVNATGFDISCGFVPDVNLQFDAEAKAWTSNGTLCRPASTDISISSTRKNLLLCN